MDDDEHLLELLRRLRAADDRRHRTAHGSAEEQAALEETETLIDRIIGSDRGGLLGVETSFRNDDLGSRLQG